MTTMPYHEKYRPQYHFTARQNWLNDPNGLVYYEGAYHLFFQHNPQGTEWGNMTWGHAVSSDLLRWRQVHDALLPDALGTMFSGSAVVDWNNTAGFQQRDMKTIVLIYTAAGGSSEESKGQRFTQCIACSTDGGKSFTKYAHNPILGNVIHDNRDPKAIWHAPTRRWIMALYLDQDVFGLFASPDLKAWARLQDIEMPGCSECPDFFEMPVEGMPAERRWVYTASNGRYLVGAFDGYRFAPEFSAPRVVDYGANIYAVQTYSDMPDGRRVQMAWMAGGIYPGMPFNQQMSFPCELRLARFEKGLRLLRTPVAEAASLHARTTNRADLKLDSSASVHELSWFDLLDIEMDAALDRNSEFTLRLSGEKLTYSAATGQLSCLGRTAIVAPQDGRIRLRILLDRTSIELFVNDGEISMTSCSLADTAKAGAAIYGHDVLMKSLRVSEMQSIWD